ncbi:rnf217 [Symbiodinium microadriaticum]|nr:rnf217 [Symbiodinium microadriaticum]
MTALNLLTAVNPRRLHFFDMNPCAILWGKMLCELILLSDTPQEFVSRLFARSVAEFECDAGQLTFRNQEKFLTRPVSAAMREETRQALSDEAASVYSQILSGYQDGAVRDGWNTPRIVPCEDRRRLHHSTRSGLGSQGRLPGDGVASFHYGEGWLASSWLYGEVRRKLRETQPTWSSQVDFPAAGPEDLLPDLAGACESPITLLFLMDMFSSEFASAWSPDQALRMARHAGRLLVAQTITAQKSHLLQELIPGQTPPWMSLSDWDSMALLPQEFCRVGASLTPGCRPPGSSGEVFRRCHPLMRDPSLTSHMHRLVEELTRSSSVSDASQKKSRLPISGASSPAAPMKRRGQPPAPKAKGKAKKSAEEEPRKRICHKAAFTEPTRKRLGKAELAAARVRAQEVVETAFLHTQSAEAALRKEAEDAEAAKKELQTWESAHAKAAASAAAAQLAVEESVARAAEATERAAEARRRAEEAEALAATAKREAEARQETFRKCQGEAAEAERGLQEEVLRGEAQRQAGDEAKRRRSQEENLLVFKLRSLCEQLGISIRETKQDMVEALEKHLEQEGYEVKRPKTEPTEDSQASAATTQQSQPDAEVLAAQASAGLPEADQSAATGPPLQEAAEEAAEKVRPPSPVKVSLPPPADVPMAEAEASKKSTSSSQSAPADSSAPPQVASAATSSSSSTVVLVVEGGQFRVENTFPAETAEAQQHELRRALADAAAALLRTKAEEAEAVEAHKAFVVQMESRAQAAKPVTQKAEEAVAKAQDALKACDEEVGKVQRVKQSFEELFENPSDKAKTKIKALRTALKPYGLDEAQLQGLPEIMVKKKAKRTAKDKKVLTLIQETLAAQLKGRRHLSETCRSEVQRCQKVVDSCASDARSRAEELQQAEAARRAKEAAHEAAEEAVSKTRKDLEEHEAKMTRAGILRFNSDAESCLICCDERRVDAAVMLGCGHGWYCPSCINHFVEADK